MRIAMDPKEALARLERAEKERDEAVRLLRRVSVAEDPSEYADDVVAFLSRVGAKEAHDKD